MSAHHRNFRVLAFLMLVAPMLLSGLAQPGIAAAAYSCGSPSEGHCYAQVDWNGARNSFWGGDVTIYVSALNAGPNNPLQPSFITNETWIGDRFCGNPIGGCWIEAGIIDRHDWVPYYFWADVRPQDSNISIHYFAGVGTNSFGGYATFSIARDPNNANDWNISAATPTDGYFLLKSTQNAMQVTDQTIGTELSGYSGNAYLPQTTFSSIKWIAGFSGGSYVKYPQTTDKAVSLIRDTSSGPVATGGPPYGYWSTWPSQNPNGGVLVTYCC